MVDLLPNTKYAVMFRSRADKEVSDWSKVFYFTTGRDEQPPPVPDPPTVFVGIEGTVLRSTITITWNGKLTGQDPPTDFAYVELHRSIPPMDGGFTPSPATLTDTMRTAGSTAQGDVSYDVAYFYKLVSVDYSGNRSNGSAPSLPATPKRLVNTDLGFTITPGAQSITTQMLQDGAVDASKILANTITSGLIAPLAITDTKIAFGAIVADKIANSAVTHDKIGALAITSDLIAANAIVAGKIAAGVIGATEIAANAIIAGKIAVNAISAGNILANAITADKIDVGAVTAAKISATAIDGKVITGATVRTAPAGGRVEMNAYGLYGWMPSGQVSFILPVDGSKAYFRGDIYADQFRSTGANLGSADYIEIGRTTSNTPDVVDEIRMFVQGNVSSLRDPGDRPGTMRISTNEYGVAHLYNFGYYGMESNRYAAQTTSAPYNYMEMNVNEINFAISSVGGRFSMVGDGNGNGFYRFGSGTGAGILCLASGGGVNVRNYANSGYTNLYCYQGFSQYGWNTFSALKYKKNVAKKNIDPISIIKENGLYSWDWREDSPAAKDLLPDAAPLPSLTGLIADYMPDWMLSPDGDGYNLVSVSAVLWEAAKTMNARLEALEKKVP